jgi:DNA mismatch endonuclease (patch repair protein)
MRPARSELARRPVPDRQSLLTDPRTSARLARVRQRDTWVEQAVGGLLAGIGCRYRRSNRDLPGSPDFANRSRRWAVFVHGCFWHGHAGCSLATVPKRNREFWQAKFAANRKRDRSVLARLRRDGYVAVVIWQCELSAPDQVDRRLRRFLLRDRGGKGRT